MSTIDITQLTEYPTKATQFDLEPIICWWVQVPTDTPHYAKVSNEDDDDDDNNNNHK